MASALEDERKLTEFLFSIALSKSEDDRKIIMAIYRKIVLKKGQLAAFMKAIQYNQRNSGCAIIETAKTGKGRITVNLNGKNKNVYPHAESVRLWNTLRAKRSFQDTNLRASCGNGFGSHKAAFCINPFHYELVDDSSNAITVRNEKPPDAAARWADVESTDDEGFMRVL